VYHKGYYLTAKKHLLQKIIFVFRDMSVSPVAVYITMDECVPLNNNFVFDVLLTVHLSINISVFNQLDA